MCALYSLCLLIPSWCLIQPALFSAAGPALNALELVQAGSQPVGYSREWNVWPEALHTTKKMFQINLAFPFPVKWREALQRDLDKLAIPNPVTFNKGKCRILYLGWGKPGYTDRLGNEMLESSTGQRDLGILEDGKLDWSQHCPGSQGGHPSPGGHQAQHGQSGQGRDCPILLCPGAASLQCWGSLGTTIQESIKLLESFQRTFPGMGPQQLLWATCAGTGRRVLSQYGTGKFTMARAIFPPFLRLLEMRMSLREKKNDPEWAMPRVRAGRRKKKWVLGHPSFKGPNSKE